MDYLDRSRKGLAWDMVHDPNVIIATIEEFRSGLESVDRKKSNGLWMLGWEWRAEKIEDAIILGKGYSVYVTRISEDLRTGRIPRMKDGIRYLEEFDGTEDSFHSYQWWSDSIAEYLEFFADFMEFTSVMGHPEGKPPKMLQPENNRDADDSDEAIKRITELLRLIYRENPDAKRTAMLKEFRARRVMFGIPGIQQSRGLQLLHAISHDEK